MPACRSRPQASRNRQGQSEKQFFPSVHYKTVQTIWRDPYHGVNTKTLERIAEALNVSKSELFEDVPGEEEE